MSATVRLMDPDSEHLGFLLLSKAARLDAVGSQSVECIYTGSPASETVSAGPEARFWLARKHVEFPVRLDSTESGGLHLRLRIDGETLCEIEVPPRGRHGTWSVDAYNLSGRCERI